ncbi:MAG: Ig-like domain-containing protein, partial [Bacteroidota bacterium]
DEDRLTITRENTARQPRVDIYQPSRNPFETNNPRQTVLANVDNVNNRSEIEVSLNGRRISNWQFSAGRVTVNLNLSPGNNTVRIEANTPDGYASDETRLVYGDPGPSQNPPTVNITRPIETTVTVEAESYNLRANTENITRKSQVDFTLNGQRVNNFAFNTKSGQISANLTLRTGSNNVRITVTNENGTAQDAVNIRYVPSIQSAQPPEVTIQSPANNSVVENNRINLRAIAKYVTRKQDVQVTLNGQNISGFSFQPVSGSISATLTLRKGTNTVIVRGTNEDGTDQDQINIRYVESNPPTVKFTRPNGSSTNSTSATYQVKADVTGVSSKSQLRFTTNGSPSNNFTLNGTQFVATVSLREGDNNILLKATNNDGSAEDNVMIRYAPKSPPTVNIIKPANGTQATGSQTRLEAKVTGVYSKSEITVLINGRTTNSFSFSSGTVRASVALRNGQNTLAVKVSNAQGSDQDQVTVRYAPKSPPTVKITKPRNGSTVSKSAISVEATTTEISSKTQVEFLLNGRKTTAFTFSNQTIKANLRLREGKNTILIKVSNSDGNDSDQISVTYQAAPAPTVSISKPRNGTQVSSPQTTLEAKVTGVSSKSEVSVLINGQTTNSFSLSGSIVRANVALRSGQNTLVVKVSNAQGSDQDQVSVRYSKKSPPTVDITKPRNGSTVGKSAISVEAKTTEISSKTQIEFLLNGRKTTAFTFSNQTIKANLRLREGKNTILIKVSNSDGNDSDQISVTYEVATPKPIVDFTTPQRAGGKVTRSAYTLKAKVQHVTAKEKITLRINGRSNPNFTFDSKSGTVTARINLKQGTNQLQITATNSAGTGQDNTTVIFEESAPPITGGDKPTVEITNVSQPATNPFDPNAAATSITAKTSKINRKNQITITINGTPVTDFTFNISKQEIKADIALQRGNNTIKVKVQNRAGSAEDTSNVDF